MYWMEDVFQCSVKILENHLFSDGTEQLCDLRVKRHKRTVRIRKYCFYLKQLDFDMKYFN